MCKRQEYKGDNYKESLIGAVWCAAVTPPIALIFIGLCVRTASAVYAAWLAGQVFGVCMALAGLWVCACVTLLCTTLTAYAFDFVLHTYPVRARTHSAVTAAGGGERWLNQSWRKTCFLRGRGGEAPCW